MTALYSVWWWNALLGRMYWRVPAFGGGKRGARAHARVLACVCVRASFFVFSFDQHCVG
jgi:hypothetical protein